MSFNIREKDRLNDQDILKVFQNWNIVEEEDLPIIQRIILHLLDKIKELENRIIELEKK